MRVTCKQSQLNIALGVVNRTITARGTIPILNNVLVEATESGIRLTATDLDTSIIYELEGEVDQQGAAAVPARTLSDITQRLQDMPVTLELEDGKVRVHCGSSSYEILSLPAEDYPTTNQVTDSQELEFPQSELKEALHLTTFAASNEQNRSILMGVLFEARESELLMVATDTHRLALKKMPLTKAFEEPISAVIPAKPLAEIERLLKDSDERPVKIKLGLSQVQITVGAVTIVSRLLDGKYPNYEKVLPTETLRKIRFERTEMLNALKRVDVVAYHSANKIRFTTSGDKLELSAESADVGSARETVPISMDGEEIQMAFNARFIIEVLDHIDSQYAILEMKEPLSPGLLKAGDQTTEREDYRYVAMPMQV